MSSTSQTNPLLLSATEILTYYGYSFMLVFGFIGNFLNIVLFLRKKLRTTSCNNYFLASAFSNLIALNVTLVSLLYTEAHPYAITYVYCKTQGYLMNVSLQISRYLILLACFDRYALCSINASLRKFCHVRVARRYVIPSIIVICLIIPLHVPIYETAENNTCVFIEAALYNSIYGIIMIGIIPPALMFILSLLIFHNLKLRQRRRQIYPTVNENLHTQAKDQQVLAMLLVQVVAYVVSSTPYTITSLYLALKSNSQAVESMETKSITTFILFITDMLRLVCPFTSFYLFILVSRLYRKEMVLIMRNIYRQCSLLWIRNNNHQNNAIVTWHSNSIRQTELRQQQRSVPMSLNAVVT